MLAHGALDAMIDALGADGNGHAAAAATGGDSARSSRRGSHRRHEKPADPLMSMDTLTLRHVAAAVGHLAQLPEAQHRLAEAGAVAKLVRRHGWLPGRASSTPSPFPRSRSSLDRCGSRGRTTLIRRWSAILAQLWRNSVRNAAQSF